MPVRTSEILGADNSAGVGYPICRRILTKINDRILQLRSRRGDSAAACVPWPDAIVSTTSEMNVRLVIMFRLFIKWFSFHCLAVLDCSSLSFQFQPFSFSLRKFWAVLQRILETGKKGEAWNVLPCASRSRGTTSA